METLGYDLKSLGYSTHAIHNHRAVFYNRNTVFANMGLDTFTSIEYMSDVEKTPKNWAKDNILTESMLDGSQFNRIQRYDIYHFRTGTWKIS